MKKFLTLLTALTLMAVSLTAAQSQAATQSKGVSDDPIVEPPKPSNQTERLMMNDGAEPVSATDAGAQPVPEWAKSAPPVTKLQTDGPPINVPAEIRSKIPAFKLWRLTDLAFFLGNSEILKPHTTYLWQPETLLVYFRGIALLMGYASGERWTESFTSVNEGDELLYVIRLATFQACDARIAFSYTPIGLFIRHLILPNVYSQDPTGIVGDFLQRKVAHEQESAI